MKKRPVKATSPSVSGTPARTARHGLEKEKKNAPRRAVYIVMDRDQMERRDSSARRIMGEQLWSGDGCWRDPPGRGGGAQVQGWDAVGREVRADGGESRFEINVSAGMP